jgi:hypothetical protein
MAEQQIVTMVIILMTEQQTIIMSDSPIYDRIPDHRYRES